MTFWLAHCKIMHMISQNKALVLYTVQTNVKACHSMRIVHIESHLVVLRSLQSQSSLLSLLALPPIGNR